MQHAKTPKEGNRDKLLRGALECLQERGYANTSSRDIAVAAGANVASINYHFGGKEALLNEALGRCFETWGTRLREAITATGPDAATGLSAVLTAVIDSFDEFRDSIHACVESFAPALRSEPLRARIAAGYADIRRTGAEFARQTLTASGIDAPDDLEAAVSVLIAVCDGLMLQWLVDPEGCPDAATTLRALTTLGALTTHI